ncbi:uncharacterized protein LOC128460608 [Pleuronectes platessa]|uniref:uncharacterized protein LOC128460608 n=1 Tax=Pleuronectes platessa TaxID=8262 RepID=UPI00232A45E5|nr:uncharacterized protein LOC128460608 [Pleuronectes platessa]
MSEVCYLNGSTFQCRCEDQYVWSSTDCAKYEACDEITNDTCSCISSIPSNGHYCQPKTAPPVVYTYLISVELNIADVGLINPLRTILSNISYPISINHMQISDVIISTVCSLSSSGYQCRCEDQYRWSCDQCFMYGSCDNITSDTCGCINAIPADGQHCQPVDQYISPVVYEYIITMELNTTDVTVIDRLRNISYPVSINNNTQVSGMNISTVCSPNSIGYQCRCEDQYRWSCDQCFTYGSCDITSHTCGCINAIPADGQHCQPVDQYNFTFCSVGTTTLSPTTSPVLYEYIITIELNTTDVTVIDRLRNISYPVSISNNTQVSGTNISTVCSQSSSGYQCRCEDQYRWSCDQCFMYGSCDNITSNTCGCIKAIPADGQHCQPFDQYNFTFCSVRTTTLSPTTSPVLYEYIITIELNTTDVTVIDRLRNISYPVSISNNTQVSGTNISTVCSQSSSGYQCRCEDQYRWSCDPCFMYGSCDNITSNTCGCIKAIPADGQHCQPLTDDLICPSTTPPVVTTTTAATTRNTTAFLTPTTTATTDSTLTTHMNTTTAATTTVTDSTPATTNVNTTTVTSTTVVTITTTIVATTMNTTAFLTPTTTAITDSTLTTHMNTITAPTTTVTNSTSATTHVNTTTVTSTTVVTNSTPNATTNMTTTTAATPTVTNFNTTTQTTVVTNSTPVATTVMNTTIATTPVPTPANAEDFKSVGQNENSITLQWKKVENILTYVLVSSDGLDTNVTAEMGNKPVTHVTSGLTNGTKYNFTLFTVSEKVRSSGVSISAFTAPPNAEDFKSVGQNETSVTLHWKKVENILTYVLVSSDGEINVNAEMGNEPVTHVTSGLTNGTKYNFTLFTVSENVRSSGVSISAFTAPSNAEDFKPVRQNETSVTLQWKKVENILTYVLVSSDGLDTNVTAEMGNKPVTHVTSGLTNGTKYNFTLFTVSEKVRSSGVSISAFTAPPNAEDFKSVGKNETSVTLQWKKVENILTYVLVSSDGLDTNVTAEMGNKPVTHVTSGLTNGTKYNFTLFTVSKKVRSSGVSISAFTVTEK